MASNWGDKRIIKILKSEKFIDAIAKQKRKLRGKTVFVFYESWFSREDKGRV